MRIVATSDTHAPSFSPFGQIAGDTWQYGRRLKTTVRRWTSWPKQHTEGDVFIHAGDFMRTGYLDEWYDNLDWFASLPHKTKLLIPGNHDFHLKNYPGPALQELREVGVWVVGLPGNDRYATHTLPNGMRLLGLPYITNHPRWCWNATDLQIEKHLNGFAFEDFDIVVSHVPVYSILDRVERDGVVKDTGIYAYKNWFDAKRKRPKIWIHGHIHENYGIQVYGDSTFYNVAMCDREYRHVNSPVVIDV